MIGITEVARYWNNRPCNIRHSTKEIGTREYFDEVEERKYFVEPHIPTFAKFYQWSGKKVLELGCGLATDSINFARSKAKLTCVELSEESLKLAKERFKVFDLNAKFYQGNIEELSSFVPVEKYDLIYSFGVIHHTPNPEKVFEEMKKYMNKDTLCKIMIYSKHSWKSYEFFLRNGWKFGFSLKKTIQYFAEAQLGCPVAYTYTKKDIEILLRDFEILKIEKTHIFPYKIKDYIRHIYKKRFIFKIMPKWIFSYLESILGWHFLITFKLKN